MEGGLEVMGVFIIRGNFVPEGVVLSAKAYFTDRSSASTRVPDDYFEPEIKFEFVVCKVVFEGLEFIGIEISLWGK